MFCDAMLHRVVCYKKAGDYDMVYSDCTSLLDIEGGPFKDMAHHYRAKVFAHHSEWFEAIEENKKALLLNPRLADAFLDISNAYTQLGKEEEAEENRQAYEVLKRGKIWKGEL